MLVLPILAVSTLCLAGGNTCYLMINKYYLGRLRISDFGWVFEGNHFNDLADYL